MEGGREGERDGGRERGMEGGREERGEGEGGKEGRKDGWGGGNSETAKDRQMGRARSATCIFCLLNSQAHALVYK